MVNSTSSKRRRDSKSYSKMKPMSDITPCHTPAYLFSSITYKQTPDYMSFDAQDAFVTVSPQPSKPAVDIISGDVFATDNSKSRVYKIPMRLIERFHQHHTITHLKWHQHGTFLASADDTGRVALWDLKSSVDHWSLTYEVDLHQPIAAFLWLRSDRSYSGSDELQHDTVVGPRNPYGHLGFVVVTVHGEVSVHYHRNAGLFSSFSTMLPKSGRREMGRADMGCFGTVLSGLEGWQRISHASIEFTKDGELYLSTYYSSAQPRCVYLYKINLHFPSKSPQGSSTCQLVTKVRLTAPLSLTSELNDPTYVVTQILLTYKKQHLQLVVCFGKKTDTDSFGGFFARWQFRAAARGQHGTGDMEKQRLYTEKLDSTYLFGLSFQGRFITCIASTCHGSIVLGLSDGSVHLEYHDKEEFSLSKTTPPSEQDDGTSIGPGFWQVTAPSISKENHSDMIASVVFSPHETHLLYLYYSGRLGVARVSEEDTSAEAIKKTVHVIGQMLKLSLLNNTSRLDLTTELVRLGRLPGHQDTPEKLILEALVAYEDYYRHGHLSVFSVKNRVIMANKPYEVTEDWCLSHMGRAYGLALGVFRHIPEKRIQFKNMCKAIQLPVILECFMASCATDHETVGGILESENLETNKICIMFEPESLLSLIPLATWTLDYVRWILQQWTLLLNTKRPTTSSLADITARPVHAILLVHKPSRIALRHLLVLIHHFTQFIVISTYEPTSLPESQFSAHPDASNLLLQHAPILTREILLFLKAFDLLDKNTEKEASANGWPLLLSSRLPQNQKATLIRITEEYKSIFAQPSMYLEVHSEHPIDVIHKRRIDASMPVRSCVNCHQICLPHPLPPHTLNTASALWYQSIGSRCLCGGLFT
ncbi:hypothetical protein BDF14DRAFT_1764598 [Spinellus fusiger]|nr:hypothetical protein BDF14DRAFT_1764598 [Spinellus fusiger]